MTVVKTICIKPEHKEWLEENHISLSRLVQSTIDELMKKQKKEDNKNA